MTETGKTAPACNPSRKTMRWLMVALGISLALNLFVGGYVIGRAFHAPHMFGGAHPGFHELARDLSPEGRAVVDQAVRDKLRPLRGDVTKMREIRDRIHRLMTADEVDFDALNAAFEDLHRHNEAVQSAIQAATIEVAKRLPPEERRKLQFGWRHSGHHDRMPPPPE